MKTFFTIFLLFIAGIAAAQSNGIGTNTPDASALVDMRSTTKGVLFPRMTLIQRDAIPNPAYGLHVFNTDIDMLEFYDSTIHAWKQYGSFFTIHITSPVNGPVQFPTAPYAAYLIVIDSFAAAIPNNATNYGPVIAIDLANFVSPTARIVIINHGAIRGAAGTGGAGGGRAANAASTTQCGNIPPGNGGDGGAAISAASGQKVIIYNYGTIAGGGGGGGGGKYNSAYGSTGGGGGTGAGGPNMAGAAGNSTIIYNSAICVPQSGNSNPGAAGTYTSPGAGGSSSTGGPGGSGGNPGQGGYLFLLSGYGLPGAGGKAVQGNAGGNTIINGTYGVVLGVVD